MVGADMGGVSPTAHQHGWLILTSILTPAPIYFPAYPPHEGQVPTLMDKNVIPITA